MKEWVRAMSPRGGALFYSVPMPIKAPVVVTSTQDWLCLKGPLKDGTVRAAPQTISPLDVRDLLVEGAPTLAGDDAVALLRMAATKLPGRKDPLRVLYSGQPPAAAEGARLIEASYLPPGEAWVLPPEGIGLGLGGGDRWALVLIDPFVRAVRVKR